jgi:hypothetical protein
VGRAKVILRIAFGALHPSVGRPAVGHIREPESALKLPKPRPTVVYRELPEGAILFCTRTEVYYSLNPVGARIWKLLPPICATEEDIVARISEEYPDINLGKISADVRRLIDDFVGNGLADVSRAA